MNTSLLKTINWIIDNYGENILEHPDRLKLLFKTHAKNEPVEERVAFGRCIENGCYKELKKAKTNDDRLRIKNNLIQKLQKNTGINYQQCSNAIDLLDMAIFKNVAQKQIKIKYTHVIYNAIINKKKQISKKVKNWSGIVNNKIKNKKMVAIIAGITAIILLSLIAINKQNITNTETNITIENDAQELQRIIEQQEALAARIEQLRNQIDENQRNQNNNTQTPRVGTSEQNQLIENMNNELLMELLVIKRQGMRDIGGRILVNIVPINYRNRNFRMNPNNLRNTVNESLNIISQHAREYNTNITFDVVFDNGSNGRFMSLNNSTEAINLYQRFRNTRYDFTVLVFAIDTEERSYITRRADYTHAIMWFKEQNGHSANTLAHEIYHAFGADDLYYEQGVVTREVEQNFRTLLGNSIMLSSRNTRLDPINAWLIGWNKNPEPWFAWFVDRRDTSNLNFFEPNN